VRNRDDDDFLCLFNILTLFLGWVEVSPFGSFWQQMAANWQRDCSELAAFGFGQGNKWQQMAAILHLIGDPEICWVNDAEIVGDGVSQMAPVSWDGVAKKREHGGGEFSEGSVAFVVGDVLMHQTP
jgi:hypothetical protein